MHVRIHIGNGNFPDHEKNIYKFMLYLFKFQKLKKLAIFKMDLFSVFFTFFNMFLILKNFVEGIEHTLELHCQTVIKNVF